MEALPSGARQPSAGMVVGRATRHQDHHSKEAGIMIRMWLAMSWALAFSCWAAEGRVSLSVAPEVAPRGAAMPRLAHPTDEAERRSNAAVARLDDTVRKARAECQNTMGRSLYWDRTVAVPMRGPRFLSYVVTEDVYCGGAHPNGSTWAVVYDLRSGKPVDWTALLPHELTGTPSLMRAEDGTRLVQLSSPKLWALYRAGYGHGGDPSESADCKQAIKTEGETSTPPLSAWLDAELGGLVLHLALPHVVQNCEDRVVLSTAMLRREGVSPELVEALEATRLR